MVERTFVAVMRDKSEHTFQGEWIKFFEYEGGPALAAIRMPNAVMQDVDAREIEAVFEDIYGVRELLFSATRDDWRGTDGSGWQG